jgi:ribosome recycling factor
MDPLAQETKKKIDKVLDILKGDLGTIRTGRATPSLVENVIINAYGGTARLKVMELATIGTTDSKTLVITPFDQSVIHEIQKGIEAANAGLTPVVDGNMIRISIPPLTQERREELIKAMKHKLENGRIMVRQVRHEGMEDIKKSFEGREDDIKRLEKEVQKMVDSTMETIDDYGKQKEQELLQI